MKIGIITTSFPRWKQDYTGIFVLEAARAIQQLGNQVKVITMHSPGSARYENWEGIEVYRTKYLPVRWELLKSEGGGLPEVWRKNPKARIQIIPFIFAFMLDVLFLTRDCDLLHANWTLAGAISWLNYLITAKPYVVTIHGSDIYKSVKLPFVRTITRISLNKAKKVLVVSEALSREANAVGVLRSKIEIITDGVDTRRFTPLPYEQRQKQVLFVGSLIERKGVTYLIQAFAKIAQFFPDIRLILIGEGYQRQACEQLSQSLGIAESVIFTGPLSQEQVGDYMQKALLLVLPSIEEGLGVVLLEALACGTPIVASEVGGIPDVVDEQVGITVPPHDPEHLAQAITSILQLPREDWNSLHNNAYERAKNQFDWTQIAERIISVYRN